jgi:GGDEF domain-containing protein
MIARLMGELILTYHARHMLVDRLAQVIGRPKVVDPFFKGFATESDFIEKVEQLLAQVQAGPGEGAVQHLSLIAINIDQLTTVSYQHGEQAARNLVRAVGRRIQQAILRLRQGKPHQEIYLYRICGDHFLLLLKDVEWKDVWDYARQWHEDLKQHSYAIDAARVADEQSIPVNLQLPFNVKTSMAVVGYEFQALRAMLESWKPSEVRANLTLTLDTGINLAKEAGRDAIARLEPGATTFVVQRDPEKEPAGS